MAEITDHPPADPAGDPAGNPAGTTSSGSAGTTSGDSPEGAAGGGSGVSAGSERERRLDAFEERVVAVSSVIHAAEAELRSVLRDMIEADLLPVGFTGLAHCLSFWGGFTPTEASSRVRTARSIVPGSALGVVASEGRISAGLTAAAARVSTPAIEDKIAEVVVSMSPAQALRVLADYREAPKPSSPQDPDPVPVPDGSAPPPEEDPETWCRAWTDDQNMFRLDLRDRPESGAVVLAAIEAMKEYLSSPRTDPGATTCPAATTGPADTTRPAGPGAAPPPVLRRRSPCRTRTRTEAGTRVEAGA